MVAVGDEEVVVSNGILLSYLNYEGPLDTV